MVDAGSSLGWYRNKQIRLTCSFSLAHAVPVPIAVVVMKTTNHSSPIIWSCRQHESIPYPLLVLHALHEPRLSGDFRDSPVQGRSHGGKIELRQLHIVDAELICVAVRRRRRRRALGLLFAGLVHLILFHFDHHGTHSALDYDLVPVSL